MRRLFSRTQELGGYAACVALVHAADPIRPQSPFRSVERRVSGIRPQRNQLGAGSRRACASPNLGMIASSRPGSWARARSTSVIASGRPLVSGGAVVARVRQSIGMFADLYNRAKVQILPVPSGREGVVVPLSQPPGGRGALVLQGLRAGRPRAGRGRFSVTLYLGRGNTCT